jgi:hypothetical protein
MKTLDEMLYGPGYCNRCGLMKPLAMVHVPGVFDDEEECWKEGEISLDPHERTGYCHDCALAVLEELKRTQ